MPTSMDPDADEHGSRKRKRDREKHGKHHDTEKKKKKKHKSTKHEKKHKKSKRSSTHEKSHKRKRSRSRSRSPSSSSSSSSSRSASPSGGPPLPPRPPATFIPEPAAWGGGTAASRFGGVARRGGKGGLALNGGLEKYLRCAACNTDSSGEAAFLQHINGKAHLSCAGRRGFVGLLPNACGVIPPLVGSGLRSVAAAMGMNPDGSGSATVPWCPPLRRVSLPPRALAQLEAAVQHTTELRIKDKDVPSRAGTAQRDQQEISRRSAGDQQESSRRAAGDQLYQQEHHQRRHGGARQLPPPPPTLRDGGPHRSTRAALPAFSHRGELLRALSSPVCIVEGETGSGKTTQVITSTLIGKMTNTPSTLYPLP